MGQLSIERAVNETLCINNTLRKKGKLEITVLNTVAGSDAFTRLQIEGPRISPLSTGNMPNLAPRTPVDQITLMQDQRYFLAPDLILCPTRIRSGKLVLKVEAGPKYAIFRKELPSMRGLVLFRLPGQSVDITDTVEPDNKIRIHMAGYSFDPESEEGYLNLKITGTRHRSEKLDLEQYQRMNPIRNGEHRPALDANVTLKVGHKIELDVFIKIQSMRIDPSVGASIGFDVPDAIHILKTELPKKF